jgi:hypothetical protein
VLFSVEGTGKYQLQPGQESMGDTSLLSHCSLLRKACVKPTDVLEHCRDGESNCWFSILGAFPSDGICRATKDVSARIFFYINFSPVAICVNYVGEFLEIFEATTHFSFMTLVKAV